MAKRTWEPRSYPIRDPRSTHQQVGRVINPPRGLKLGGTGEASILNTEKGRGVQGVKPVSDRGKGGR